ncbi:hypothetical protein [Pseudomonas phage vB_Pa-PAC2]
MNITVSNPIPLDLTEDKIMTYAELIKKFHSIEAGHYLSNNEVNLQTAGKNTEYNINKLLGFNIY